MLFVKICPYSFLLNVYSLDFQNLNIYPHAYKFSL